MRVLGTLGAFGALLLEETAQVVDVRDSLEFVIEAVQAPPLETFLLLETGLDLHLLLEVGMGVFDVLFVLFLDLLVALLLV